jgi:hypothetical protein
MSLIPRREPCSHAGTRGRRIAVVALAGCLAFAGLGLAGITAPAAANEAPSASSAHAIGRPPLVGGTLLAVDVRDVPIDD